MPCEATTRYSSVGVGAWGRRSMETYHSADPRLPTVHTHSRPIRSERWPSAICPGMPARLTSPSAQAASVGLNPISTRYLVWWTWTAYQEKRPEKYPTAIHQKRAVRMARPRVQSTATQAGSTILLAVRLTATEPCGA